MSPEGRPERERRSARHERAPVRPGRRPRHATRDARQEPS
jgi:hypothetical protein